MRNIQQNVDISSAYAGLTPNYLVVLSENNGRLKIVKAKGFCNGKN